MLNRHIGTKIAPFIRPDNKRIFSTFGPYVGIIKNNIDPTAAGRLQVYIPEFGGPDENNPSNWVTLSYASPFRGQTRQRGDLTSYIDYNADFTTTSNYLQENSFQSYGFWFVPPDLNGRVLCFFANGDPSQGYWTACIQDSMDAHMVPAIGAVPAATSNNPGSGGYVWEPSRFATHAYLQRYIQISGNGSTEIPYRLPVSEPVLINQANSSPTTPSSVLMVPQVYQTLQLGIQGLAFDFLRGTTSASSVRENPSQVFGISTPGRLSSFANVSLSEEVIGQMQSYVAALGTGEAPPNANELKKELSCQYRTGGHQFVMDDGDISGNDQGVRIRTTGGNEIMLDDTNGQIYIVNRSGNAWIEMSPSGFIDIYSHSDFSVHSEGNLNFHANKNINLFAGGSISAHSNGDMNLESTGQFTALSSEGSTVYDSSSMKIGSSGPMNASAKSVQINGGSEFEVQAATSTLHGVASMVKKPNSLSTNNQYLVSQQSGSSAWWSNGTFPSTVARAPSHEPWPGHEISGIKTSNVPVGDILGNPVSRSYSGETSSGVRGTLVGRNINESDIAKQPNTGTVCSLNVNQTKALLASIAKNESSWPSNRSASWRPGNGGSGYYAVNSIGYTGKYQFGAAALETYHFLKSGASKRGNNANVIGNSANWVGFMGCYSANDFLNNPSAQEWLIMAMMRSNCKLLRQWGILNSSSTPQQIAGYLGVCQLVGAGGALTYYRIQNPTSRLYGAPSGNYNIADANGESAGTYYNVASNAVSLAQNS